MRLISSSGTAFFLKTNSHAPQQMFSREAEGLQALAVPGAPRVPQPYLVGAHFLLLEDLAPARPAADYWTRLGHRLAGLHNHVGEAFGFPHDNFIGSTPQPNPTTKDGYIFFAEHRLLFQTQLARRRGLLSNADEGQVRQVIGRLEELIPVQPPSLIHGDLWSGNAIADEHGQPALIDPAAHYGWAEAELGMTALFGGFPEAFYQAYQEIRPLQPGYRERFSIYNLYHLLNHVNLFGAGYLGRTRAILSRFA
jgi:fructosamine-3-kinase